MSETEGIQRLESPFGASSSSIPKQQHQQSVCLNHLDTPKLNTAQFRAQIQQFSPNSSTEHSSKRVGIPPSHPQIPPLLPYSTRIPESLPPRKTHRRSNSDIPFGYSTILQSSPPLIPLRTLNSLDRSASLKDIPGSKAVLFVKSEGEVVDDLFSYMNVDNFDKINSSRAENCEDLGSRASVTKVNGGDSSDNEATSSVHKNGGDIAPTRHYRSMSMDSVMLKMNFADELPTLPRHGGQNGQISLVDASTNTNTFSLEFGNGEFTAVELKKIMANEKLVEIALTDPKKVKRILANRQSAARSKERKMHYITELEHKVQTLETETTTLSAQHTLLQRDLAGLTSQNNELKFRLQAMERQAQLRDALNEALTAEVQRWKITNAELSGDANKFSQLSIDHQMFDLHQQQNNGATNTITHE